MTAGLILALAVAFGLGGLSALGLMTFARWWEHADRLAVRRYVIARRRDGRVRRGSCDGDCDRGADRPGVDGMEGR